MDLGALIVDTGKLKYISGQNVMFFFFVDLSNTLNDCKHLS